MLKWAVKKETSFSEFVEPCYRGGLYSLPIPSRELRAASSIGDEYSFFAIGEAWAHIVSAFLSRAPHVLDVGCSCGKLARFLYLNPEVRYVGLDIDRRAINWCAENFAHLAGDRFEFVGADVHSALYNPTSSVKAENYCFPFMDRTFTVAVAASLFTHLLEVEATRYLSEIARVLRKNGKAIISIHVDVPKGERFVGDSRRIDIDPDYFISIASGAGLVADEIIGNVYGQEVMVFRKSHA